MSHPGIEYFTPPGRELKLVFQGSIPIPSAQIGELLYESLKELLLDTSDKTQLNGQIMKMLEPCCLRKKGENLDVSNN